MSDSTEQLVDLTANIRERLHNFRLACRLCEHSEDWSSMACSKCELEESKAQLRALVDQGCVRLAEWLRDTPTTGQRHAVVEPLLTREDKS